MFRLIRNAHVYAPADLGVKDILIAGNRIEAIGDHIDFPWPDTQITEAQGRIVMPGLIDGHAHIIGGGGEDGFASLIRELQMTDCIRYGVTSVVGLLGTDHHAKHPETLVARTKALREQGISAWCLTGSYTYPSVTITGNAGKDVAMIEEIIGVKIAVSDHRSSAVTKEELARLATQVRTAGLLAKKAGIVHMHMGRGKDGLRKVMEICEETDIPITQFRPTHCGNLMDTAIPFAKAGGYIDFTAGEKTPGLIAQALQEVPAERITMSSDANGSFPVWNEKKEIIGMGVGKMETLYANVRRMVNEYGISFAQAISFLTVNPAEALKLKDKGVIEAGADADLVMLDEDGEIDTVFALGQIMMQGKQITAKNYYDYQ